jgi:Zn-finger nucleic acid-binding protein
MTRKCPNCSEALLEVDKHGVRLDYCVKCKGVWLDKGEVDQMLDSIGTPSSKVTTISHDSELRKILEELRKEGRVS